MELNCHKSTISREVARILDFVAITPSRHSAFLMRAGRQDLVSASLTVAVYPVGGWWKYRTGQDRWENSVRFSLVVSIDVPDENIDIYTIVENLIDAQIEINTEL